MINIINLSGRIIEFCLIIHAAEITHKKMNETVTLPIQHRIKLLGIGTSKDVALRQLVDRVVLSLDLNWPIEEIKDLDLLIKHRISGIPALIIDEKIILQENVPSFDELSSIFKTLTLLEGESPTLS